MKNLTKTCICCHLIFTPHNKNVIFCSRICMNTYKNAHYENRILEESKINKRFCKSCFKELTYKKIQSNHYFCNHSCSAKYNISNSNMYSTKSRVKQKLTKSLYYETQRNLRDVAYMQNPKLCLNCKSPIERRKSKTRKCCSNICSSNLRSKIMKEKYETPEAKALWKLQRSNRSKKEIELFDLCNTLDTTVLSNHIICDKWDSDIVLPDYKIAIAWNGAWHYQEVSKHFNHSLKQTKYRDRLKRKLFKSKGWKVFIFEDRYWTPQNAFKAILNVVGTS